MVDRRLLTEKVDSVQRSLKRINAFRGESVERFSEDAVSQDVVLFHLMQAIQACIDLASPVNSDEALGLAGSTHDFFYLLADNGVITRQLCERMILAVGFRNLVAHEYTKLDLEKVFYIAHHAIGDIEEYLRSIAQRYA
ncbi:type VII toxin-antitoxin system HepT family RNase toxin [Geomesophilobacter sediminis]|uniref:DUF86 domain-containing protein n=1 Tax=Geomesophilobacter sediminis TaxID=2798584 RepID=A0A8J7IMB1_9BACT|nr:DUF86 domain-containing protein [Geomesophilobacter sediminis]MBJ6723828.1 DUF86 domain-containing protein [Geomesophilobacter sediminis]